jgi:hypothetical protein
MHQSGIVGRKLTMLAMVVLVPGGLMALCAIALFLVLARTERGRRVLHLVRRRMPARLERPLRRTLALVRGEKAFLVQPPRLHSA